MITFVRTNAAFQQRIKQHDQQWPIQTKAFSVSVFRQLVMGGLRQQKNSYPNSKNVGVSGSKTMPWTFNFTSLSFINSLLLRVYRYEAGDFRNSNYKIFNTFFFCENRKVFICWQVISWLILYNFKTNLIIIKAILS